MSSLTAPIRVLIEVEGGCVVGIYADDAPAGIQVAIVDWDNIKAAEWDKEEPVGGAWYETPDEPIPDELREMVWDENRSD